MKKEDYILYGLILVVAVFAGGAIGLAFPNPACAGYARDEQDKCYIAPIPTDLIVSPTGQYEPSIVPTDVVTSPSATVVPTATNSPATPTPQGDGLSDGRSDGRSDNRSDGKSSSPEQTSSDSEVQSAPMTGKGL